MLTLQQYSDAASKSNKIMTEEKMIFHMCIGLSAELDELHEALTLGDYVNIKEEFADLMWFTTNLIRLMSEYKNFTSDLTYQYLMRKEFENSVKFTELNQNELLKVINNQTDHIIATLATDISKINDIVKKVIIYEKEFTIAPFILKISRLISNIERFTNDLQIDLADALNKNIQKLEIRYQNGYSDANANNRDLDAEKKALS